MNTSHESPTGRRWPQSLAAASGAFLLLAAAGAVRAEFNAIGAIAETRLAALILAVAAAASFLAFARLSRRRWPPAIGLALSLLLLAFAIRLSFFTYHEQAIRFESADGTLLAGTLFAPRSAGPHPAVVFSHGSGRATRAEFLFAAKLFARHGFAALAYDKRGSGESGGSTWEVGYDGYAADAIAAVESLAEEPVVDAGRIGLFGHSEGGWVAPLVAEALARSSGAPAPAFVIVTSTTSLTPADQVLYETRASLERLGYPEAVVGRATRLQERVLAYQRSGTADPALERALAEAAGEDWFGPAELPTELHPPAEYAWWRSVMDYDPLPHWRRVGCPVLAISGGLDENSDVHQSLEEIREALAAGGNDRFTGRIFPQMEHGTIEWWLPLHLPPPRFPVGYPDLLVDWSREVAAGAGTAREEAAR